MEKYMAASEEDDDEESELVEESRNIAQIVNRRNANRRHRTLNTPEKTVQPGTPASPPTNNTHDSEITEGDLLEGPGTYQGLKCSDKSGT